MPEYTEEDKKKLIDMAFDFKHANITSNLDMTNQTERREVRVLLDQSEEQHEQMEKLFRNRFLVDTRTAEELKEAFPDLYERAQTKRRKLEARANVSGFKKIKTDLFGSKKRKAQARLEEIAQDQQKLEEFREAFSARSRLYENKARELHRQIDRRREELESQLATANEEQKVRIQLALNGLKGNDKSDAVDGVYELQDRLYRASDYCVDSRFAIDTLLQRKVRINPKSGKRETLDGDKFFRDLARFTCPMFHADEALSKTDKVWKMADSLHCIRYGTHLVFEEPKEEETGHEVPREATPKEQADNLHMLKSHLEGVKQEYTGFMESHPELYLIKPKDQDIIENFDVLNEAFKKSQVTDYAVDGACTSRFFKMTKSDSPFALSDEEKKEFWELHVFLRTFKYYNQNMMEYIRPRGHIYLRHDNVSPGEITDTFKTFDEVREEKKMEVRRSYGVEV